MMENILTSWKDSELIGQKNWIESKLEKYGVSYTRGFVPDQDPLLQFTDPYFSVWDEIFKELTSLVETRLLQQAVQQMPLLDHNNLRNEREWERAWTVLSTITQGYVWQNGKNYPAKIIPKCLAVPLVAVTEHIGGCPVASYWSALLNNWKIKDETRPLDLRNVEMQTSYTGSEQERWFFLIHWQIEMQSVPAIRAVSDDNTVLLSSCLSTIEETFQILKTTLKKMYELCDPAFFFTKLRTFLLGWKNNKSLPDGIIYEGVSTKPLKYSGATGGQSAVLPLIDAVLGIVHSDCERSVLDSMLEYMPRQHREFVLNVRKGPTVRIYVDRKNNVELQKKYNDCVESLAQFRSTHIQVVARYITIQAAKEKTTSGSVKGTGNSDYMAFLKKVRNETADVKIQ